ncbi:hypothetical protein GOODEAATRI_021868 [Goodea atripinnis]|uniref:Uncharacterized protein n=1 Tax=Goodea atripinnis TaxID=208336 RepID=A0ABV0PG01_9TELE
MMGSTFLITPYFDPRKLNSELLVPSLLSPWDDELNLTLVLERLTQRLSLDSHTSSSTRPQPGLLWPQLSRGPAPFHLSSCSRATDPKRIADVFSRAFSSLVSEGRSPAHLLIFSQNSAGFPSERIQSYIILRWLENCHFA